MAHRQPLPRPLARSLRGRPLQTSVGGPALAAWCPASRYGSATWRTRMTPPTSTGTRTRPLDLTRLLIVHGGQAQLIFRLCEKAGISNYRVRVRFDDITLTGCHTTGDPGFERTGRGWTYSRHSSPTAATSSVCSASTLTTTTPRGRTARSSSARLNPRGCAIERGRDPPPRPARWPHPRVLPSRRMNSDPNNGALQSEPCGSAHSLRHRRGRRPGVVEAVMLTRGLRQAALVWISGWR
jgi:hypothetical protein